MYTHSTLVSYAHILESASSVTWRCFLSPYPCIQSITVQSSVSCDTGAADSTAPQTPLATTTICTKFSTYAPFNLAAPAPTPAGTLKPKTLSFTTEAHETNSFDQIVGKNDAMSVPDAPRPSVYAQGWPSGLRPLLSRGVDNIQELPVQYAGSSMAGHTHPLSPSSSAPDSPGSPVYLATNLARMNKRPRMETRFKRQLSAVNLGAAENNAA
jgi:hypothetical protein